MKVQQKDNMKKVTFRPTVNVKTIVHIDDYTIEEIQNCFYSQNEYREFKLDVKRTAKMMDMKQLMYNDEEEFITERGCEKYIATSTRKQTQRKSLNAVLNEQMRQYYAYDGDDDDEDEDDTEDVFVYDDEKIASIYNEMTRDCVAAAYIIGLSDAVIAKTQNHQEKKVVAKEPSSSSRPEGTDLSPLMKSGGSSKLERRRTFIRRRLFNAAA